MGLVAACLLAVLATASAALASDPGSSGYTCPSTDTGGTAKAGSATVDGTVGLAEWGGIQPSVYGSASSLPNCPNASSSPYTYFFTNMYRAGKSDFPIESRIYLKVDTSVSPYMAYILVLADPRAQIQTSGDQFVKFGINSLQVSSGSSDFAYVGRDARNGTARGWEAKFALPGTSCISNLNVHAQVLDGGSQTSAVRDRSITLCPPPPFPLRGSLDAAGTGRRTYTWDLVKTPSITTATTVSNTVPVTYDIRVTRTTDTDHYQVTGTITVRNTSNAATNGVTVSADLDATSCAVSGGGTLNIPANSTRTATYTCDVASDVAGRVVNATIGYDGVTISASSVVPSFTYTTVGSETAKIIDHLTPPATAPAQTDAEWGPVGANPGAITDSRTLAVPDEGCWTYHNLAKAVDPSNPATVLASDEADVETCRTNISINWATDPTPQFKRTYDWTIDKSVDEATIDETSPNPVFTINAHRSAGSDSDFAVTGQVTITNPSGASVAVNVSDRLVDSGGVTTISGSSCLVRTSPGGTFTPLASLVAIPANSSQVFDLSCTLPTKTNGFNEVTVSQGAGSSSPQSLQRGYTFGVPTSEVHASAAFSDVLKRTAPTLVTVPISATVPTTIIADDMDPEAATGGLIWTWTYSQSLAVPDGSGDCYTYDNAATVTLTSPSATVGPATADVEACRTGPPPGNVTIATNPAASFTRTYPWTIEKTGEIVLPAAAGSPPTPARANYVLDVNKRAPADTGFSVTGNATITNTTGASVTREVTASVHYGDGFAETVDCVFPGVLSSASVTAAAGSVAVPKTASASYTCNLPASPDPKGAAYVTVTATGGASPVTADQYFTILTPTTVHGATATLSDVISWSGDTSYATPGLYTVDSPPVQVYTEETATPPTHPQTVLSEDTTLVATNVPLDAPLSGSCREYTNTATLSIEGGATAEATRILCVEPPGTPRMLGVGGYSAPGFTRTYAWELTKTATDDGGNVLTPTSHRISTNATTAIVHYDVTATRDAGTDSEYVVTGEFVVTNATGSPSSFSVDSAPAITPAGTCAYTETAPAGAATGASLPIASGAAVHLPFRCTATGASKTTSGHVTVTVSQSAGAMLADVPYTFVGASPTAEIDARAKVFDAMPALGIDQQLLDTTVFGDSLYTRGLPVPPGVDDCLTYTNTATLLRYTDGTVNPDDVSDPASVSRDVEVCRTGSPPVGGLAVSVVNLRGSYVGRYDWSLVKEVTDSVIQADGRVDLLYGIRLIRTETGQPSSQPNYRVIGAVMVSNYAALPVEGRVTVNLEGDPTANCTLASSVDGLIRIPGKNPGVVRPPTVTVQFVCTNVAVDLVDDPTSTVPGAVIPVPVGYAVAEVDTPDRLFQLGADAQGFSFGTPTTYSNPSVTLSDIFNGAVPEQLRSGALQYASILDGALHYTKSVTLPADRCLDVDNTVLATVVSRIDTDVPPASVEYYQCPQAEGLTMRGSFVPRLTRSNGWSLTKSVGIPVVQSDGSIALTYQVDATRTASSDSGYQVIGSVELYNPNPWPATYINLRAELDSGGTCSVTSLGNIVVGAGESKSVPIVCTLTDGTPGTLTVTARRGTTSLYSVVYSYSFDRSPTVTTINGTVNVTDQFNGGDVLTLPDGGSITSSQRFVYRRIVRPKQGCNYFPNTAQLTSVDGLALNAAVTVQICVNSDGTVNFYDSNLVSRTIGRISTSQLVQTQGVRNAVLLITKSGPTNSKSRRVVNYQVRVMNAGGTTLRNVVITDMLPSGLDFSRVTLPSKGQKLSTTRARWTIKSLGAGKSVTLKVPAWIASGTTGRKCNIAMVSATGAKQVQAKSCMVVKGIDPGSSAPTG